MLAVGEGASKKALDEIRKLGSQNIIITSMKPVEEEVATRRTFLSVYGLLNDDEARIRDIFSEVETTVPVKLIRKEARLGERTLELRVVGTTPKWFELVKRPIIGGRLLVARDEREKATSVVLTEYGARRLLATRETIGQSLRIGRDYFEVVGIVKSESSEGGTLQTPDQHVDAYLPISTVRERFGDTTSQSSAGSFTREKVELHQLIAQVRNQDDVERVAIGIEGMLRQFHKKKDYQMSVPLALLRQAESTQRVFNIVLGSIAGISLLVGGIGIMNIMLASVTERTREIGVRRAIGAKRKQIIGQFLIETVVLSTVGGIIGIGIGLAIPWLITYFAGMPTVVRLYSLVLSLGISMGVGIVFGIYPAMRAAKLDPIVALRHE